MCSFLRNNAFFYHKYFIRSKNSIKPVCYYNYRTAFHKPFQRFAYNFFRFCIKRCSGLIKNKYRCIAYHRSCYPYSLTFATRKCNPSFANNGIITHRKFSNEPICVSQFSCLFNFFF